MKKLSFILLILSVALVFNACSKTDSNMPQTVVADKAYELTFLVGAGQSTNVPLTMSLTDYSALGAYTKNVYKADIIPAEVKLTITGITAGGHELEGVKFNLEGTDAVLDLGKLTADKTITIANDINFLQSVANRMVAKKSAEIKFTTTKSLKDINRDVPILIKMSLQFHLK